MRKFLGLFIFVLILLVACSEKPIITPKTTSTPLQQVSPKLDSSKVESKPTIQVTQVPKQEKSEVILPKLFTEPLFSSPDDFKYERALDLKNTEKMFIARGSVIGLSETKNILRLFFSDSGKAFSELNFKVDGMKRNLLSKIESSENSATYIIEMDNRFELKKTKKNFLRMSGQFEGAQKVEVSLLLPNEEFLSTILDIDGKKLTITDDSATKRTFNFPTFKKITFRAETKDNAFAISTIGKNTDLKIEFGKTYTRIQIYAQNKLSLSFDMGESKRFTPTPPPKNSCTKVGHIDFWEEERMVLADTNGKNLLQNASFEGGFQYMAFRYFLLPLQNEKLWETKPIKICETDAKFGSKSLEIRSDKKDAVLAQRITTASVPLKKGTYTFSVWAKSNYDAQSLVVSAVDASALYDKHKWQSQKFDLTKEWKRYKFTFTVDKPQLSPIVFEAISDAPAICRLDGMQLEKGSKATKFERRAEAWLESDFKNNLIEQGKNANARLNVVSSANATGDIEVEIFDFFGEKIFSKNFNFNCDNNGFAKIPLAIDSNRAGVFLLKTKISKGDDKKRYNIQRFMVAQFLENKHARKNLFVDTYVDPLSTHQNFPEILDWYKKLGYGARAGYANRDNLLSKTASKYGVDSLISYIGRVNKDKKLERAYIFLENVNWFSLPNMSYKKALLLDDFHNTPAGDITPEYLKKVENIAEYLSKKYDGVKIWANVCEPEGTMKYFANPAFAKNEDFLKFIEMECAVARGVRKGNPNAKLSTSVTSTLARDDRLLFFERLLTETSKRGIRYDCVGAHNYRGAPEYPRPTLEDNYLKLFDILKKHGYENIEVFSPEGLHWLPLHCYDVPFITDLARREVPLMGVLPYTYDIGHGERLATALRARSWLIAYKHDRIKTMNASNYGVSQMDADLSPYAYHKIPNTFGNILGDAKFVEDLNLFPDTRCYVLNDRKKSIAVLWACKKEFDRGTERPPKVSINLPAQARLFDLMQAEKNLHKNNNGKTEIQLSIFPIFIVAENVDVKDLIASLKSATWMSNIAIEPNVKMSLSSPEKLSVEIGNPYGNEMKGKVALRSQLQDFSISANSSKVFEFTNHTELHANKIKSLSEKISLDLSEPIKKEFLYSKSSRFFKVKNSSNNIKLDGNLSEWESTVPAITLENMRRAEKLWRNGIMPQPHQFSARYRTLWRGDKLYMAIEVWDDKFIEAQNNSIEAIKGIDSIEIIFDSLNDAQESDDTEHLASDDWRYRIWKTKDSNVAKVYREFVPDVQMTLGILGAKSHTFADDVKGIFKRTQYGYIVELEFSSDSVLPFKVAPNAIMGLGVIVNDSDDPKSPEPDARLTNSSATIKIESLPSKFPKAILVK